MSNGEMRVFLGYKCSLSKTVSVYEPVASIVYEVREERGHERERE
jgi:hypothetical protein